MVVRFPVTILLALAAWSVAGGGAVFAQDLPEQFEQRFSPPGPGGDFGPPPPFSREFPPPRPDVLETSAGYVFINGEYLEPPYAVTIRDHVIEVNGQSTGLEMPSTPRADIYPSSDRPGRARRSGRRFQEQQFRDRLPPQFIQLQYGAVVLIFDDAPAVALEFGGIGKTFLKALNDPDQRPPFFENEGELLPDATRNRCEEWLASYAVPTNLRTRSEAEISELETDLAAAEVRAAAYGLLQKWNFPLNVCALVLVLAASGHLFCSAPFPGLALNSIYALSKPLLPVGMSLTFVTVLSGLDLAWTLLLSQAGLMEEANPIARIFIEDPTQLAIFKAAFTFGAIGIIGVLYRFRPAQVGAWWACLICTLLATRWLVFHTLSM